MDGGPTRRRHDNGGDLLLLLSILAVAGFMMTIEWPMVGALLAGATLLTVLYVQFVRPALRRGKLRRPCKARFIITSATHRTIDYAVQNEHEHFVSEITLPANSEVDIELLFTPKVHFHESGIAFGCDETKNLQTKPYVIGYFNRFIEKGLNRLDPESAPGDHYLDHNKYYHMRRDEARILGRHFVVGYKLKTRDVGVYRATAFFVGEEVEGRADLTIVVEDPPRTEMRCIKHYGCRIKPRAISARPGPSGQGSDFFK
jgi:hypothetical protein